MSRAVQLTQKILNTVFMRCKSGDRSELHSYIHNEDQLLVPENIFIFFWNLKYYYLTQIRPSLLKINNFCLNNLYEINYFINIF